MPFDVPSVLLGGTDLELDPLADEVLLGIAGCEATLSVRVEFLHCAKDADPIDMEGVQ